MARQSLAAIGSLFFLMAPAVPPVLAQAPPAQSWTEVKCERYRKAWTEALARRGTQGIGAAFIASHDAFLESGCVARADVCPSSREELALANILTIAAMNAGTSSTFLPFACRK